MVTSRLSRSNWMVFICLSLTKLKVAELMSPKISVSCELSDDPFPVELLYMSDSNPSVLRDLRVTLGSSGVAQTLKPVLNISWAVSVDNSIRTLSGTWIDVMDKSYRCHYEPPFSKVKNITVEQLWFHFADILAEPNVHYAVTAYNLPVPPDGAEEDHQLSRIFEPGCSDKHMRHHPGCNEAPWDPNVSAEFKENTIKICFNTHVKARQYTIRLRRETVILNVTVIKTDGKEERQTTEMEFHEHCDDKLNVSIMLDLSLRMRIPVRGSTWSKVNCDSEGKVSDHAKRVREKDPTAAIATGLGCICAVFLLIFTGCHTYKYLKLRSSPWLTKTAVANSSVVEVLIVYPAVDPPFQQGVATLANFLQSRDGISVTIDIWQGSSLAKQGPLRWLNTNTTNAKTVLFVLPPKPSHTWSSLSKDTDVLILNPGQNTNPCDYTVPASAYELYSLALNMVSSQAKDARAQGKFWVVHLGQPVDGSCVPVELKCCRRFTLLKDLEKLLRNLTAKPKERFSGPRLWSRSWWQSEPPYKDEASLRLSEAVQQLERWGTGTVAVSMPSKPSTFSQL